MCMMHLYTACREGCCAQSNGGDGRTSRAIGNETDGGSDVGRLTECGCDAESDVHQPRPVTGHRSVYSVPWPAQAAAAALSSSRWP